MSFACSIIAFQTVTPAQGRVAPSSTTNAAEDLRSRPPPTPHIPQACAAATWGDVAPGAKRIGLETGPTTTWLWTPSRELSQIGRAACRAIGDLDVSEPASLMHGVLHRGLPAS